MKLRKLHLIAYGPFTGQVLTFGDDGLVTIIGPNEAGKSSTLRAILDLRFGIPAKTSDNFVHDYKNLRIGGEFVGHDGKEYALVRRKGNGPTLSWMNPATSEIDDSRTVPGDIESMLTGGLQREQFEAMYGLDHQRLRKGGEQLARGEGEVGAALFAASAGVSSIPHILTGLDTAARALHMPGARGKNAKINAALSAHQEHISSLRKSAVKPAAWASLNEAFEQASTKDAKLRTEAGKTSAALLVAQELRIVSPLLHQLNTLIGERDAVEADRLLPESAPSDRVAAQTALNTANDGVVEATAEIVRLSRLVAAEQPDEKILDNADQIVRLSGLAGLIDSHRVTYAESSSSVAERDRQLAAACASISQQLSIDEALKSTPSATKVAEIKAIVSEVESAAKNLVAQRKAVEALEADVPTQDGTQNLPTQEAQTSLRAAIAAYTKKDVTLQRAEKLPSELGAARRHFAQALAAIGIADKETLLQIRPLMEGQIDDVANSFAQIATIREQHTVRLEQIDAAIQAATKREIDLAGNAAHTTDELTTARHYRDTRWSDIRQVFVDGKKPPANTTPQDLADQYQTALSDTDDLADAIVQHSDRAAELLQIRASLSDLRRDHAKLEAEVQSLDTTKEKHTAAWTASLTHAQLPSLSPKDIRSWQIKLSEAIAKANTVDALEQEEAQHAIVLTDLAVTLRTAITETGLAAPSSTASLATLAATATEIGTQIAAITDQSTKDIAAVAERAKLRKNAVARTKSLETANAEAREALAPHLIQLHLSPSADIDVVKARLIEFEHVKAAKQALEAAQEKQSTAKSAIDLFDADACNLAHALGDSAPTDAAAYSGKLSERFRQADASSKRKREAEAGRHQEAARKQKCTDAAVAAQKRLLDLYDLAGVSDTNALIEAEQRSKQKRTLDSSLSEARKQLNAASSRSVEDLKSMLSEKNVETLTSEFRELQAREEALKEEIRSARDALEKARTELNAIDSSDSAVQDVAGRERAAAAVRAHIAPWIRNRLAHALLEQSLKLFRERAQGPMLRAASTFFTKMTDGEFVKLVTDNSGSVPILMAQRKTGEEVAVDSLSEGTRDQLFLSLRMAAIERQRDAGSSLPVILDDVLMTSDDGRAGHMLQALADFGQRGQVVAFTHHEHMKLVIEKMLGTIGNRVIELQRRGAASSP